MVKASYHQRVLPSPPAIDFASDEGVELFYQALLAGMMVGFFKLISYFQTQSELTYCGLASLAMVLNALHVDPGRTWKAPWRWFDESMLDYPEQLEKVKAEGISLWELALLAQRAGAEVKAFQTSRINVDFFRRSVIECCSSNNCHLVSSYHRASLKQAGTGHFSPIGGYHGEHDMVLILDVARFKYPPHWVPLTLLWEAMDTVDKTGETRGFMLISKPKRDTGLLYTLSCKNESWVGVVRYLMDDVPHLLKLKSEGVKDINGILSILLASRPSGFGEFIQSVAEVKREQECGIGISEEEKQRLASREELLKHVQDTSFFKYIVNFLSSTSCCSRVPVFGGSENLDEITASVCCHGAEILSGKSSTSGCSCCHETCVKCMKVDGHETATVLSSTTVKGKNEEKVNMLVHQSLMKLRSGAPDPNNCTSTQPVGSNILTVLLLMLPPETWRSIKDEKLREEVQSLVSMDNLPPMLQREVLHLRRQLYNLKKREVNMVKKKSPFAQKEAPFLGHIHRGGQVRMDQANTYGLTTPVMDMLKEKLRKWTDQCQKPSDQLKQSMTKEEMLVFPDHSKPYEVETGVSDYAIDSVLMQDEPPVAFESWKLNDAKRRYTVQEEVDCNSVTDELCQVIMELLNTEEPDCHHSKKELKHDQRAQRYARKRKIRQFECEDDLYIKGQHGKVRKEVLCKCRNSKWAWRSSKANTTSLIEDQYYRPQMRDDLQQDKLEQRSLPRLLEPLPIPTCPLESVSMNFIMNLPKSKECQTLMVVVDWFSKHAMFVPAKGDCPAEEAIELFSKHVVPYWGVPQTIVSDRDVQFTEHWIELFKLLGSKLNFSISPHPQTDSQTENVNALLEIYFRHYVSTGQANWAELINVTQFSYNFQFIGKSSFEIATEQQPQTPSAIALGYQGKSPSAYKSIKDWQGQVDLAQARLHEALEHMKKWVDKKRRHVKFQVGDLVYVKLHILRYKDMHKDLTGPFRVLQRVGKVAYELALPSELKVHPVFHVSMLNNKEDLDRGESQQAQCDDPSTSRIR